MSEQHFTLPHTVAGLACLPGGAVKEAGSIHKDAGQANSGAEAAALPAFAEPAGKRGGTQQVCMLSRYSFIIDQASFTKFGLLPVQQWVPVEVQAL